MLTRREFTGGAAQAGIALPLLGQLPSEKKEAKKEAYHPCLDTGKYPEAGKLIEELVNRRCRGWVHPEDKTHDLTQFRARLRRTKLEHIRTSCAENEAMWMLRHPDSDGSGLEHLHYAGWYYNHAAPLGEEFSAVVFSMPEDYDDMWSVSRFIWVFQGPKERPRKLFLVAFKYHKRFHADAEGYEKSASLLKQECLGVTIAPPGVAKNVTAQYQMVNDWSAQKVHVWEEAAYQQFINWLVSFYTKQEADSA